MTIMSEPARLLASARQLPIKVLAKVGIGVYGSHDLRGLPITVLELLERYRKRPCVVECPLAHCRWFGPTGLAYGPGSLHPYVQSLLQHLHGEYNSYQETSLAHYWRSWTPVTLAQSLGIDRESAHPLLNACPPLNNFMPWGGKLQLETLRYAANSNTSGPRALGTSPAFSESAVRHVGPKPDWFGELRIQRLVSLHQQIASEGYRQRASACLPFFRQHIVLDCMVRADDVRFLVANGQHRASVLSVMGQEFVPVLLNVSHKRGPSVIRRSESSNWPLVRMGLIAESDALDIFDRVFDGRQPDGFPVLMRAGDA